MTSPLRHVMRGINVVPIVSALQRHPELWNEYRQRTESPESPHYELDDIWLRFAEPGTRVDGPHQSVWYPSADLIPVKDLAYKLMGLARGDQLGGVLLTRIKPGQVCKPHEDSGWHAEYYTKKYAVQLAGNQKQAFHFEGVSFSAVAGDVYEFDNSKLHWVTNDSDEDRMTLIVCIKPETRSSLCHGE